MKHVRVMIIILLFSNISFLYPYIDPGSGSYILQLLIAGFLGGLYTIKVFWNQIKVFFINLFRRK